MDQHFLAHHINGEPGFSHDPWYNPYGDCIVCLVANEAEVAERIDGILTIYRSATDNRPIGFEIKGVSTLLKHFGADALAVRSESSGTGKSSELISVSALLLAAYEGGPKTLGRRDAYSTLMGTPAIASSLRRDSLVPA